jgi:hypothetical protein
MRPKFSTRDSRQWRPPNDLNKSISNIAFRVKSFATSADKKHKQNFASWTRVQLIELLINEGKELRYESQIPYSLLREQAEEVTS